MVKPAETKTPRHHDLKIAPLHFLMVESGDKTWELRKNDRDYSIGDTFTLKRWSMGRFDGKEIHGTIGGLWVDLPGLEDGYCIFTFAKRK